MSVDVQTGAPGALWKNERLKLSKEDPFGSDLLEREVCAENLTRLIQTLQQPFVISISSGWGTGKTTFVEMWRLFLEKENHRCLFFNAWENDFAEEPFVALVAELDATFGSRCQQLPDAIRESWQKAKENFPSILTGLIGVTSRGVIRRLAGDKSVKEATAVLRENEVDAINILEDPGFDRLATYHEQKDAVAQFRQRLGEFVQAVCDQQSVQAPVVFFIDELDRCRPTYAVELLERIKHLFDVPNLLFVISLDSEQLAHSVRGLYGSDMDAQGYLRRFFDLEYQLPRPEPATYTRHLWKLFRLDDIAPTATGPAELQDHVLHSIAAWSGAFELTLRDQQRLFTQLNVLFRTTPFITHFWAGALVLFLVLRMARPDLHDAYWQGRTSGETLRSELRKLHGVSQALETKWGQVAEAAVFLCSQQGNESESSLQSWYESDRMSKNARLATIAHETLRLANAESPRELSKRIRAELELSERISPDAA